MRAPHGYATIVSDRKWFANGIDHLRCEEIPSGTWESDTVTCGHFINSLEYTGPCSRVIHIKPRMDPADMGGLCKQCMKWICPSCVGKGCTPLEKGIEAWERKQAALRSYGF